MKVVFLDFSGTVSVMARLPGDDFDRVCLARVDDLCRRTGAVIVIISDWVKFEPAESFPDIKIRLRAHGFLTEVLDHTTQPEHNSVADRPYEIWEWLSRHPEVVDFVILDDMPLLGSVRPEQWERLPANLEERLAPRFLRAESAAGMTDEMVERAVQILGRI